MTNEELAEVALRVRKIIRQESLDNIKSGKIIATRDWLDKNYGEAVMRELVKKKLIFPYAFGTKEVVDTNGYPLKIRKGAVYYRVSDVESIIEDYNLYKTLQCAYKKRRIDFRENIRKLEDSINK